VDIELDFEKRYRLVREIIETVVLTVLMFMVIRLAVQNFNVDGHSMEPTLHNTELILVDKWTYLFRKPARGDVIVFIAPPQPSQDYVKRIIGLPGDIITIQNTTVYVNGVRLNESYVVPTNQGNPYPSFVNRVVPPDSYLVLGDNRAGSSDSRDWGCVPAKNIIGQAALVYWPLGQDNNGLLHNESAVFNNVPRPSLAPGMSFNTCPIMNNPPPAANVASQPDDVFDQSTLIVLALPGVFVGLSSRRRKSRRRA
jgi:signal peptidase I